MTFTELEFNFKFFTLSMMARFFIVFCVLSTVSLFSQDRSQLRVQVSAKAAILINAETGTVLWEKNAHVPLFPASTTKIFTALYALEKKGHALHEMVTASPDALSCVPPSLRRAANSQHPPYRLEHGGTHMGLKVGETLPLKALFYGLMLTSGNDAANVIAQHTSGSVGAFMEELNRFVREKGCLNTTLYTPHGMPHEGHKTTAYDMAIFAKEAMKNPFFREVVKATQYPRPMTNKQPEAMLYQHNGLVKPGKFYYPKAIGIKTGYTLGAGFTLVSAAEDAHRKLIVVVLGCEKIEDRYRDAIALFEAGFNEKRVSRTLFSKGFDLFSQSVDGANGSLQAYLAEDVLLSYFPSEEPAFKTEIAWAIPELPIAVGQQVGEMRVLSSEGKKLASAPIYAAKELEGTFNHQMGTVWKAAKKGMREYLTLIVALLGCCVLAGSFYYSRKAR